MAFPTVQARSSGATTAVDTTSHAITMPSGITTGDLLVITFSVDNDPTCTASSGWIKLGQESNGVVVTGAIFYKIAVGGDTCTITTSSGQQSSHVVHRISGAGFPTGTPTNGSSTNSNPANHDPAYTRDFLWIATRSGDTTVVASAAPSSYGNLQTQASAGASGASTNTAERDLAASAEDPGTFTSTLEQWVCWTLAIPEAFPLSQTLTDNFDDNSIDGAKWTTTTEPGVSVVETGQQLVITTAAGTGSGELTSTTDGYSLVGSYVTAKIIDDGDAATTFFLPCYVWSKDAGDGDAIYFSCGDNTLQAIYRNGFSETRIREDTAFDAVNPTHLRLREEAGAIYYDYSTDGGLGWTNYASELVSVMAINISRLALSIQGGRYDVQAGSTTFIIDDYNILPTLSTTKSLATLGVG